MCLCIQTEYVDVVSRRREGKNQNRNNLAGNKGNSVERERERGQQAAAK